MPKTPRPARSCSGDSPGRTLPKARSTLQPSRLGIRDAVSYKLYSVSKSVLDTLYSVKKCLTDSLSVLFEVGFDITAAGRVAARVKATLF